MNPARRGWHLTLVGIAGSLLSIGVLAGGCKDDLPDPTAAQVTIRFLSSDAGLANGGRVILDGVVIRSSLSEAAIDTLLPAGPHTFIFRKTCVAAQPSDSQSVQVEVGVPLLVDFHLAPNLEANVLAVQSDPPGQPIRLNGAPTGRSTPASFVCLEPGRYEVALPGALLERRGFDLVSGDTLQVVDVPAVGRAEANFSFVFSPKAQTRGVLLELYTATFCPNCPKADEAAADLEADPAFEDDALACVQFHLYWGGSDPFFTEEIGDRVVFYGDDQSAPYVFFNGKDKVEGSSNPDLVGLYRGKIQSTYGQTGRAGLYWSEVRLEGAQLKANLRFVAVDDLTAFGSLSLHAFVAKDSLVAMNPYGVPHFDGVVRDLIEPVPLGDARDPGDFIDREISFDLASDATWISPGLHLVAFVQDATTREIIQCREVELRP